MASKQRDVGKEQYWRDVLRRQTTSRFSVAEFWRRERLSQPSFYAWRRTIGQRDGRHTRHTDLGARAVGFLPVRLSEVAPRVEASITIELAKGLVLRLPESIAVQRLAELVQALEARREP